MTKEHRLPIIGISIGDLNGIGPEVVMKTLNEPLICDMCTPVLFASVKAINFYRKVFKNIHANYNIISDFNQLKTKHVNLFTCWQEEVPLKMGEASDLSGKYAVRSLEVATQCLKDKQIDALVTAPINKHTAQSSAFPYSGHTPYLKDFFGIKDVAMILYFQDLRVSMLTEHLAIKDIASHITKENLISRIDTLYQSLQKDFGIDNPSIAVLGLNPHNGDKGAIGTEETDIIFPVVKDLREKGKMIVGPFSADSFFARNLHKDFDLVLGMYHDQVLIPFKMLDQNEGVNFTAGMPYIRTSPDHGTGFDLAGKNIADESSFRAALFAAIDFYNQRNDYEYYTSNPLERTVKLERERN